MPRLRVCLVYDCLYPWTIGGAERWYRTLAGLLAADGHDVTYLTLRQWDAMDEPNFGGVRVVSAGPRMNLYREQRRRIWPPMRFGRGVFWHLVSNRGRYDLVHCASFPFFSTIAAGLLQHWSGYRLVIDWWEVWTRAYWRQYLGRWRGPVGSGVQRLCARLHHQPITYSHLHERRLKQAGARMAPRYVQGILTDSPISPFPAVEQDVVPRVVFSGRHIADKQLLLLVEALALARVSVPDLQAVIFGDGPESLRVKQRARELRLGTMISIPGFAESTEVTATTATAMCLVLPSRREGFGLAALESIALGVPVVVVAGPDNAAVELIEHGVNGVIAAASTARDLAAAIVHVHELGSALRGSTRQWWSENRERFASERGYQDILAAYQDALGR